jgi:hypothetical protein
MEVHHHSHLASGETHGSEPAIHGVGKKFTHYIWEFLMLFLAVFCGFLAENIREHNVGEEKRTTIYPVILRRSEEGHHSMRS